MNISLTQQQHSYISTQVLSGDFQNASEVINDALSIHELYRNRLDELRSEIEKGWGGAASKRGIKDIIKAKSKSGKS